MKKVIAAEIVLTTASEELTDAEVLEIEQQLNQNDQVMIINMRGVFIRYHFLKEVR